MDRRRFPAHNPIPAQSLLDKPDSPQRCNPDTHGDTTRTIHTVYPPGVPVRTAGFPGQPESRPDGTPDSRLLPARRSPMPVPRSRGGRDYAQHPHHGTFVGGGGSLSVVLMSAADRPYPRRAIRCQAPLRDNPTFRGTRLYPGSRERLSIRKAAERLPIRSCLGRTGFLPAFPRPERLPAKTTPQPT
jgi:hypothetical protein